MTKKYKSVEDFLNCKISNLGKDYFINIKNSFSIPIRRESLDMIQKEITKNSIKSTKIFEPTKLYNIEI